MYFFVVIVSHCSNKPSIKIIDLSFLCQRTKSAGDQIIVLTVTVSHYLALVALKLMFLISYRECGY